MATKRKSENIGIQLTQHENKWFIHCEHVQTMTLFIFQLFRHVRHEHSGCGSKRSFIHDEGMTSKNIAK